MDAEDSQGFEQPKKKANRISNWKLRPSDWTDQIYDLESLSEKVAPECTIKGVILVHNEEENYEVLNLIANAKADSVILIVTRSREDGSKRIPGLLGNKLFFQYVTMTLAGPGKDAVGSAAPKLAHGTNNPVHLTTASKT